MMFTPFIQIAVSGPNIIATGGFSIVAGIAGVLAILIRHEGLKTLDKIEEDNLTKTKAKKVKRFRIRF